MKAFENYDDFVSILGWTSVQGKLGFVMERVQVPLREIFHTTLFHSAYEHLQPEDQLEVQSIVSKVSSFTHRVVEKLHMKGFNHCDFSAGNIMLNMSCKELRGVRVTSEDILNLKTIDVGLGLSGDHTQGTRFTKCSDAFPIEPYGPLDQGNEVTVSNNFHFKDLTDWHQAQMLTVLMLVNAGLPQGRLKLGVDKIGRAVKKLLQGLGRG